MGEKIFVSKEDLEKLKLTRNFMGKLGEMMRGYPHMEIGTCDIDGSERKVKARLPIPRPATMEGTALDTKVHDDMTFDISFLYSEVDENNEPQSILIKNTVKNFKMLKDGTMVMLDIDGHHWYVCASDEEMEWGK